MFGLEILDIALGLVLTYLLMSLVLTAVREAIETLLKSRATDLEHAVTELLQGDSKLVAKFYDHPLIYALHRGERTGGSGATAASSAKTISGLGRKNLPSYIPRETFAAALLDMLKPGGTGNAHLRRAYEGLERVSGGKIQLLRQEIEGWYDAAMDRASGWYKRRTQVMLFWLGLAVALLLNVNSVAIGHHLATDEQSRFYTNQLAAKVVREGEPQTTAEQEAFRRQLDQMGIPVGWNSTAFESVKRSFPTLPASWKVKGASGDDIAFVLGMIGASLTLLVGYLITAFALMLGAPFWFDVLNRIMVIRSTVKPTEKSPDEPSEEGGESRPKGAAAATAAGTFGAAPTSGAAGPSGRAPQGAALDDDIPDAEGELDGCLDGVRVKPIATTDDVELPPATGGVEPSFTA